MKHFIALQQIAELCWHRDETLVQRSKDLKGTFIFLFFYFFYFFYLFFIA